MLDPEKNELDEALKWLLDNDYISMTWDPECEEISFFMTEEQKMIHDMQHPG